MSGDSSGFFSLLLGQDAVDGGVEQLLVTVDIEAARIGLALELVQPTRGVGFSGEDLEVGPKGGLPPWNVPVPTQNRSLTALNPSIVPRMSPGWMATPTARSNCTSTSSPSIRRANLVKPTRHRPSGVSASQQWEGAYLWPTGNRVTKVALL